MNKCLSLIATVALLSLLVGANFAQDSGEQIRTENNQFWTLPARECDGENFCEVRISPDGTIYGWDMSNFRLYISRPNMSTYEVYDLSGYSHYLVFVIDFIPFDELGYVVMYSPMGASNTLSRYNLNSQTLEIMQFPEGYRLVGCNLYTGVNQRTLRLIFPLGADGRFIACTSSPQDHSIMHIINVNSLLIEQSLDINSHFYESFQPLWRIGAGQDNKIYAFVSNPEITIPNLPQIDEATQEIVLIYDVAHSSWSYQVKAKEATSEILATLPDEGIFFRNIVSMDETEIIQFDSSFQIVRRIPNLGRFQGMTANGDIFFSSGENYSDISIINIHDFPYAESYTYSGGF